MSKSKQKEVKPTTTGSKGKKKDAPPVTPAPAEAVRERWPIDQLEQHPDQKEVFGAHKEADIRGLAEDIRKNGLRNPVEVKPDGTIIAGHGRVAAHKLLCLEEVDVLVRHDLTGPQADALFLSDNVNRRQLTPLGLARCAQHLLELERRARGDAVFHSRVEQVKKQVADRMGKSPRTLNRYLLALNAPRCVQDALDAGTVSLVDANRVAGLGWRQKGEIEERVKAGGDVRAVVKEYVRESHARPADCSRAFSVTMRHLRRLSKGARAWAQTQAMPHDVAGMLGDLRQARETIDLLISVGERHVVKPAAGPRGGRPAARPGRAT